MVVLIRLSHTTKQVHPLFFTVLKDDLGDQHLMTSPVKIGGDDWDGQMGQRWSGPRWVHFLRASTQKTA